MPKAEKCQEADLPFHRVGITFAVYGDDQGSERLIPFDTINDVAKCLLVSFDSTMRSNLSVGVPIDVLGYEKGSFCVTLKRRFEEGDPYFREISRFWSAGLRKLFTEIPELSWR